MAEVVCALGNYGSKKKYIIEYRGLNSRLDEVQAAFLNVKLKYLDAENQRRREIAEYYCEGIKNISIILPNENNSLLSTHKFFHVWHLFVIRHPRRDDLQKNLSAKGIQTLIHYPIPPHKQKAYNNFAKFCFPITEKIHKEVLCLRIISVTLDSEFIAIVKALNLYN